MSTIQSTLKLVKLLASTSYIQYVGVIPKFIKESDYGVSVEREVYREILQTELGVGIDKYYGQLQKFDKDLSTAKDNMFLVFTPDVIINCISKMRYVDTRCKYLCSEDNFINNRDWCLTNCKASSEDINIPSKCLRYLYHFIRTQTYLNGGDISVVEQADPYIEKLPKVSSGEVMDPEHHNAIVDAINSLAFTAIGLNTNSFVYLALTGKVVYGLTTFRSVYYSGIYLLTRDILSDRSVIALLWGAESGAYDANPVGLVGRYADQNNMYIFSAYWREQELHKISNGKVVGLAWDLDDISSYTGRGTPFALSISGSTIKGLWWIPNKGIVDPLDIDWLRNNLRGSVIATDTDIALGRFGFDMYTYYYGDIGILNPLSVYLLEPLSSHKPAIAVIETGVVSEDDVVRADLLHDYVVPKEHEKLYNKLKSMGFDDNEIERFYRIRKVDRMSFNYGSIDYKGGSTMFLAVYGGDKDVVDKQIEYVRKKNMFADFIKPDIGYVRDLYKKIRSENRDMLITENELAYQLLGYEELELDSISDFYQREVIDLGRIRINIDREIDMWINRAKRLNKSDTAEKLRRIKRR